MSDFGILQRCRLALGVIALVLCNAAAAAPTSVTLSSEASRQAANDLLWTTVAAEASGPAPGELASEVNRQIAAALKLAQAYPSIKTRSGGSTSFPVYAASSARIDGWRMRSELILETGDSAALSELLGKLQKNLAVSSLVMQPSPPTRKKAENEAIVDAIAAFRARAQLIADVFGRPYTIKQMSVNTHGGMPMPLRPARAMAAEAGAPVEAGSSQVVVGISGEILVGE